MNEILKDMSNGASHQTAQGCPSEEAVVLEYSWLVRRCARPLFLMGGDHEDLIQEGMIGLIHAIRTYEPEKGASFATYAEHCIRNRLLTAVRNASGTRQAALNQSLSLDGADSLVLPVDHGPETVVILREEFQERLQRISDRLTPLERKVLALYLQGMTYARIGEELHRDIKSVDNAVQRIRKKLYSPC